MNRLTLERLVGDDGQPSDDDLVVPVIDGTPLFTMFDDSWPGLPMSLVAPPSGQWSGTPAYRVAGDPVILDGGCEIAECCGVMAWITIGDEIVRWSRFWTSASRPVPTSPRFEFARDAYEAEIAAVRSAPHRRWADT